MKSFAKERLRKIFQYSFYLKFYASKLLGPENEFTTSFS